QESGHTAVYEFPYRQGGAKVRLTLRVRWESDLERGLSTAWCASFSRPPWRLDGEACGLVPVDALKDVVAAEHQNAGPVGPAP
ncbi:hypothetical protein, partial [Gordonia amicalis]|uniref:hypothetical protein n=1 Tax=Gordonia amicalis TaxID=89053 RepID=UPI0002A64CDE